MRKLGLSEVKQALHDSRFRDALPLELKEDVAKFLTNPGCACNVPLYRKIITTYKEKLLAYFPNSEVTDEAETIKKLAENHWSVINCRIGELEEKLRKLPPGRKQIAIARWEDQVTVIVDELDIVY